MAGTGTEWEVRDDRATGAGERPEGSGGELPAATPPGPDGLPVLGNALSLVRDPRAFYDEMATYGDVVSYSIPRLSFCTVLHPDLIERVLVTDQAAYGKYGFEDLGGEFASEGLLLTDGEQWRRQRTAVQDAFTLERIRSYGDAMGRYAAEMVDAWEDGETVALDRAFSRLTLRVLAHSLFDLELDEGADVVTEFARVLNDRGDLDGISTFLPVWVPTPQNRRYRRTLARFRTFVEDLIDRRRGRAEEFDDLLSILLTAGGAGDGLSDVELRDTLATFLFAGHETTSLALTYTVLELAKHDDVRAGLDAEYEAVLDGAVPTAGDVPALEATDRAVRESLRLYPPAFILFREARRDVELGGYRIPEGTKLTLPQFHVHVDDRWYDDPWTFAPPRWTDDRAADRPDYAYFPFGGGPRHCIGMRFAVLELKTVLPVVLQRVDFDLLSEPDPDLSMGTTLRPEDEVRVRVRKR